MEKFRDAAETNLGITRKYAGPLKLDQESRTDEVAVGEETLEVEGATDGKSSGAVTPPPERDDSVGKPEVAEVWPEDLYCYWGQDGWLNDDVHFLVSTGLMTLEEARAKFRTSSTPQRYFGQNLSWS